MSGRIDLMYDIEPQTGFMLIDTWRAEMLDPELNAGAFRDALMHLILPAIVGHPAGGDRPHDPVFHA